MSWQPSICAACRRTAIFKTKNLDACMECLPMATTKNLDEWEKAAIVEMVAQVKAHLGMDEQECFEFVRFVFLGVGESIRSQMASGKAPF